MSKQNISNDSHDARLVAVAGKARRVMFWVVVGVVVLNILLFLRFGLGRKAEPSAEEIPKTVKPP
jgi:hypothetical protein